MARMSSRLCSLTSSKGFWGLECTSSPATCTIRRAVTRGAPAGRSFFSQTVVPRPGSLSTLNQSMSRRAPRSPRPIPVSER